MKIQCKICKSVITENEKCNCETVQIKNGIIVINTFKHLNWTFNDFVKELKGE